MPEKEIPLSRYSLPPPVSGTVRGRLGLAASSFFYKSSMEPSWFANNIPAPPSTKKAILHKLQPLFGIMLF
jgi:hypothetical protein